MLSLLSYKIEKGLKSCCKVVLITMRSPCDNSSKVSILAYSRQMVDASCGGNFLYRSLEEAWKLFEHLSEIHICMLVAHILTCLGNWEVNRQFIRFHI